MGDEETKKLVEFERSKYEKAYKRTRYRAKSPHERCLPHVLTEIAEYDLYANFGCGSGLLDRHLLETTPGILVDHVSVLWEDVAKHRNLVKFVQASLFDEFEHFEVPYAVCTDVMEHIPPEKVDAVLENIAARTPECFFQINLNKSGDTDLEKYGGHLHLTVETPEWWQKTLERHFPRLLWGHLDTKPATAPWEIPRKWYVVTATRRPKLKSPKKGKGETP